ncbi:hypothetical protein Ancab_003613 [Ancistrocladus abbreviatus]
MSARLMSTFFLSQNPFNTKGTFICLIYAVLLSVFFPIANSVSFQFSRFDSKSIGILYQGDAVNSAGAVEFNKVDYLCRVGLITYADRVQIWDSGSGTLLDFTTHFSFFIDTVNQSTYGHGLAFFMAPAGFQIPPNSHGGSLCLFNTTTSESPGNQMIIVEFDSVPNPEWDPSFRHVGINKNSIASAVYTPWNASIHSGDTADVWITYNATTKNLSVFWSYRFEPNYAKNSSLSYQIDLTKILPEWITIGFSAATSKMKTKEKKDTEALTSFNDELERGAGPRRFSYAELASATNSFSDAKKLGEGGSGGGKRQYITEVKVISRLRHGNLVQLIGWCHDKGEFLLVYEFMPNGSLDSHLFGKKAPLSWPVRYKVALGLSSALLYLHEEWEQCVVHRDIKSSNIMLDSSFNVKLGDFGLARLMDHELGAHTTGLAVTWGYMAPEYISTRKASEESDVYSFGVVALEIATGKKSVDTMSADCQKGLVE